MRRVWIAALVLAAALSGCGSAPPGDAAPVPTVLTAPPETSAPDDGPVIVGYLASSMSEDWAQDMQNALTALGEQQGFVLVTADAFGSAETQSVQLQRFIRLSVDGIVLSLAGRGDAAALVERCQSANIPVMGETTPLLDARGHLAAPCVLPAAVEGGAAMLQWAIDHRETLDIDFDDPSKAGFVSIADPSDRSEEACRKAAESRLVEQIPEFSAEHMFRIDVSGEDTGFATAMTGIAALISANDGIGEWLVAAAADEYALGAARALRTARMENDATIVSFGGRTAQDWTGGAGCWRAVYRLEAEDCASLVMQGLLPMIRDGALPEDVFSEYKIEGEQYAAAEFSGHVVTPENGDTAQP